MKKLRKALVGLALGLVALGAGSAATAANGNWYGSTSSPVIYQTNYSYDTANINPGSTPAGAVITTIDWYTSYGNNSGSTFYTNLYLPLTPGAAYTVGGRTGTTSLAAGKGALQPVKLSYYLSNPTTKTISPLTSVASQITVNFSY